MTEIDVVISKLQEAIDLRSEAIVRGQVASYEEYRHITGVVAGLQGAVNALKDVQDKYQETDFD